MTGFFSLFLNPWFMMAGVGLISAPIIIHLINRMRFRRLRWAAMEFLLKSQKRNRRRLIIEQLILLALRCLLVMLAGLLVARFILSATEGAATQHLVVLDDSLSLSDHHKEQGADKTAFDLSKQAVRDIAKKYSEAKSAQQLKLVLLSDPDTVLFEDRLNSETLGVLNQKLEDKDCKASALHLKPIDSFRAAAKKLKENPEGKQVIHFISDFRTKDWTGPEADLLNQELETLLTAGVDVSLVDVANPKRTETRQVTSSHDNLAITELRPESRMVPQDIPVQFTVVLQNYSTSELKNVRVDIKVDGVVRNEASINILNMPVGRKEETTLVTLTRSGFAQVTAHLGDEDAGLQGDNIRFAVVDVRPQVPILVVDGDGLAGSKRGEGGGSFFLQMAFGSAKGYRLESGTLNDLANGFHLDRVEGREVRRTLDDYPSIFLVNVPELNEKAQQNLEKYVRDGGGLAFFLGDKVKPGLPYVDEAHPGSGYNGLHRKGEGLFPVPLAPKPSDRLTEEQKIERLFDFQPKVYVRDSKNHLMFKEAYKEIDAGRAVDQALKFLIIDQYYPVPRSQWNRKDHHEEMITLPNRRSLGDYNPEMQDLLAQLPLKESKYEKFHLALELHERVIRNGLAPGGWSHLWQLEQSLHFLLNDAGDPKDLVRRPNLRDEFWQLPEQDALKRRIEQFRDRIKYGDPLMVGQRFGKGRVVALMTTAGNRWNGWPDGYIAAQTYPMFMLLLQKYLGGVGDDVNRTVGSPLTLKLDATRYEPRMHRWFAGEPKGNDPDAAKLGGGASALEDLSEQQGMSGEKEIELVFTESKKPGIYFFDLYPRVEAGAEAKTERRAYAFNVDADAEGDLKRAARESVEGSRASTDVAQRGGKLTFNHAIEITSERAPRQRDLTDYEWPWLYLVILLVLVLEQAMAVHLSFHLKGNEAALPAQVARSETPAAAA